MIQLLLSPAIWSGMSSIRATCTVEINRPAMIPRGMRERHCRTAVRMFVKINRIAEWQFFFRPLEQRRLYGLTAAVALADNLDDGAGVNRFVDVQRDGGHFE